MELKRTKSNDSLHFTSHPGPSRRALVCKRPLAARLPYGVCAEARECCKASQAACPALISEEAQGDYHCGCSQGRQEITHEGGEMEAYMQSSRFVARCAAGC
jgi:hypothetical protein